MLNWIKASIRSFLIIFFIQCILCGVDGNGGGGYYVIIFYFGKQLLGQRPLVF